jgi:hypothetical protein
MKPTGLIDVIHWLEGVFVRLGVQHSYGGAVAYNYYGPPRLTQDIDVLAQLPSLKIPAFVEELAASDCLHGELSPHPVELRPVLDDLRGRAHLAVFLCHGVRVELFVPWHPFHYRVLDRSPERDLEGQAIPVHAAEDLIVFKKIFDRPKDWADIKAMLLAQKGMLDLDRIRAEARELLTPESWEELDRLLSEYGTSPADEPPKPIT